jgi:hypothetical protein
MADEHIRAPDDKLRQGAPQAGADGDRAPPNGRAGDGRGTGPAAEVELPHGLLHEGLMLLRWLAGTVIVLVCGWGFILAVALADRSWKLGIPIEVAAAVAAVASLGMFMLLERNFWLSRFMGLRISAHGSPTGEAAILWALGVPGLLLRSTGAPAPETARGKARPGTEADTLREIVETIVFVIVLVVMLRTFVAEAFVIPTGSMAETLLGYHRVVTCPQCGYTFPVNVSAEVDPQNRTPEQITGCTCPNCRLPIRFERPNQEAGVLP